MKCIWGFFLLLTVVVGSSFAAESNKCSGSTFTNDPALFPKLVGYFYNLYTSVAFADNELFMFHPKKGNNIHARTKNDGKCCRTLNITSGKEYSTYDVQTDEDCQTKVSENSAQLKLLSSNKDDEEDCSNCIILWNCRNSREGVQAICDSRVIISQQQRIWIKRQFRTRRLPILKVKQTADYNGGNCFLN